MSLALQHYRRDETLDLGRLGQGLLDVLLLADVVLWPECTICRCWWLTLTHPRQRGTVVPDDAVDALRPP